MSWFDDLLGKVIQNALVNLPMRKILNFSSAFTVTDNVGNGSTDVGFIGGVTPYTGFNPNAGGDAVAGNNGDILISSGTFNGFTGWKAIAGGTPATWVPFGRAGQVTTKAVSYAAQSTDLQVWVSSTAAQRTITLPQVSTITSGFDLTVKDTSFSNSGNNTLVVGFASELIDGQSQFMIDGAAGIPADGNGNSFRFVWGGSAWSVQ